MLPIATWIVVGQNRLKKWVPESDIGQRPIYSYSDNEKLTL